MGSGANYLKLKVFRGFYFDSDAKCAQCLVSFSVISINLDKMDWFPELWCIFIMQKNSNINVQCLNKSEWAVYLWESNVIAWPTRLLKHGDLLTPLTPCFRGLWVLLGYHFLKVVFLSDVNCPVVSIIYQFVSLFDCLMAQPMWRQTFWCSCQ